MLSVGSSTSTRHDTLQIGKYVGGNNSHARFPKIIVETSPLSNLRQGLQWLLREIRPVHPDLEAALQISTSIEPHYDIAKARSSIFAAFCATRIPLVGRPGKGEMYIDSDYDRPIRFEYYGNARKISVSEITEAGLDGFDFQLNRLYHITEYDDHFVPLAGWEYVDLAMPTEKLFRTFPSCINDPFDELEEVPPFDLTGMADTRRERLVSLGAETGVDVAPIARTELLNSRENGFVPENVTTGNHENPNKSRVALPPYLQFAVFVLERLGPDTIANLKKDHLQATIKELWWETLGPSSEALVAYMATMLRLPEAKRGGAKAQKKSGR
jgi:hypothetical protein